MGRRLSAGAPMLGYDPDEPTGRDDRSAAEAPADHGPACIPSPVRAVPAANADAAVLQRYHAELDAAYELARAPAYCLGAARHGADPARILLLAGLLRWLLAPLHIADQFLIGLVGRRGWPSFHGRFGRRGGRLAALLAFGH